MSGYACISGSIKWLMLFKYIVQHLLFIYQINYNEFQFFSKHYNIQSILLYNLICLLFIIFYYLPTAISLLFFAQKNRKIMFIKRVLPLTAFILQLQFIAICLAQDQLKLEHCKNSKESVSEFMQRVDQQPYHSWIEDSISRMYPADTTGFIEGVMQGNNSRLYESVSGNTGKFAWNIVPVSIIALLAIILVPVLIATKCCRCTPCAKKVKDQPFTRKQLWAPGVLALVLLLAFIGVTAAILHINRLYDNKHEDYLCGIEMLGKVLVDGGTIATKQISSNFNNNFTDIHKLQNNSSQPKATPQNTSDQLSRASNLQNETFLGINSFIQTHQDFQNKMQNLVNISQLLLPNNKQLAKAVRRAYKTSSVFDKMSELYLVSQFKQDYVFSPFIDIIGSPQDKQSLVGNVTSTMFQARGWLNQVAAQASRFYRAFKNVDQSKVIKQLNTLKNSKVQSVKSTVKQIFQLTQNASLKKYNVGSYVVLSIGILFAMVTFFIIAYMIKKNKHECGIPLSLCCALFWLIGLLHLAMAIGFTLTNPTVYHSCKYTQNSISSEKVYTEMIHQSPSFGFQQDSSSVIVSKCLPSSKTPYYFYDEYMFKTTQIKTNKFRGLLNFTYDNQNRARQINGSYTKLVDVYSGVRFGSIFAFNQSQNKSAIIFEHTANIGKTDECLGNYQDSWVPSMIQNPIRFPCQINSTNPPIANKTTCPSPEAFVSRLPGCTGCIDAISVMEHFPKKTKKQMIQILNKRYPKCVQQNKTNLISNIAVFYTQYIKTIPLTMINGLNTILQQAQGIQAFRNYLNITPINQTLGAVQDGIRNQSLLQPIVLPLAVASNITNSSQNSTKQTNSTKRPQYSTVEGEISPSIRRDNNCRLLGRILQRTATSLCNHAQWYVYYLRFLYTTTSAILLALFCSIIWLLTRFHLQAKINKRKRVEQQRAADNVSPNGQAHAQTERPLNKLKNEDCHKPDQKYEFAIQSTRLNNDHNDKGKNGIDGKVNEEEGKITRYISQDLPKTKQESSIKQYQGRPNDGKDNDNDNKQRGEKKQSKQVKGVEAQNKQGDDSIEMQDQVYIEQLQNEQKGGGRE